MALPSWLKKLPAILKKIADIAILGRQVGLWSKEAKHQNFLGYESPRYDILVGFGKALRDFVITAGAVVSAYFAIPNNITFLGFLPDTVERAAVPVISAGFVFLLNYAREHGAVVK